MLLCRTKPVFHRETCLCWKSVRNQGKSRENFSCVLKFYFCKASESKKRSVVRKNTFPPAIQQQRFLRRQVPVACTSNTAEHSGLKY